MGELMANLDEQLTRLQNDVSNYASLMRDKVSSLQAQIQDLTGQVSSAATDQMSSDAQALSDHLDALEAALSQDSPPVTNGGDTGNVPDPGTGGDGGTTDVPPSARRR